MDVTIRQSVGGLDATLDNKWVTLPGARRISGMSVAHLRTLARRRVLESWKFEGWWLVTIESVLAYTGKKNESR